jgi:hypothetical protein
MAQREGAFANGLALRSHQLPADLPPEPLLLCVAVLPSATDFGGHVYQVENSAHELLLCHDCAQPEPHCHVRHIAAALEVRRLQCPDYVFI